MNHLFSVLGVKTSLPFGRLYSADSSGDDRTCDDCFRPRREAGLLATIPLPSPTFFFPVTIGLWEEDRPRVSLKAVIERIGAPSIF